jgi:hypothetical protein
MMAEEQQVPDVPAPSGRSVLRVFLMVAGGLAAPALALAAFFLSASGDTPTPARPAAVQAGALKGGTAPAKPSSGAAVAAPSSSTSTTLGPVAPAGPLRDPFAPLVTQAPPGGTPAR